MPTGQPEYEVGNVGPNAIVLQGANLSLGLTPAQFEQLRQQIDKSIGDRSKRLVPVPSEQAPSGYVDRPELTGPLLAHLLNQEPAQRGQAIISAVHGLGGIGKTTVARRLLWHPEIEKRLTLGTVADILDLGNQGPFHRLPGDGRQRVRQPPQFTHRLEAVELDPRRLR
jgi:hypothetical protein